MEATSGKFYVRLKKGMNKLQCPVKELLMYNLRIAFLKF